MELQKNVRVRQEKFGAVIFETLSEKVLVTNETGREILGLIQEGKKMEEVIEELAKKYDGHPAIIKAQTEEFILRLKEKGIIKNGEQK